MKHDDLEHEQAEAYRLALRLVLAADDPDERLRAVLAAYTAAPEQTFKILLACCTFLAQNAAIGAAMHGSLDHLRDHCERELFELAIENGGADDAR